MRFQVPQFIEVEDKIFGPLTFKQFIYLAGGGGMIVVVFTLLPSFLAFFVALPIAAVALALAFYKVNNRPFISVMESFFKYFFTKKLFIWKKEKNVTPQTIMQTTSSVSPPIPKLSQSKLKDLTWDLSVRGNNPENKTDENI